MASSTRLGSARASGPGATRHPATRRHLPLPARLLGLGGLLPFAFGAAMVWCPVEAMNELGTRLLGAYGAVILSFLGGVRWGRLLGDEQRLDRWIPLGLSVLPSLVGWVALLLPETAMFATLATGLVLQYLLDRDATETGELPPWYGALRTTLTIGAVPAVLSGLIAYLAMH